MKIILALGSIVLGLVVEWILASGRVEAVFSWPLGSLFTLWWLWRLPLVQRVNLGAAAGFILDALLLRPFGTYMLLFLFLALAIEFLHSVFSAP